MEYNKKYVSEELKEIALKEGINNYKSVIYLAFTFILLIILIGFLIKYPEKIVGNVYIVSKNQINKIYSPSSGKIKLLVKENSNVRKGELLALIDNTTEYRDLLALKEQLNAFNINSIERSVKVFNYNTNLKLGDIEKHYYDFLLALLEYNKTLKISPYDQKIINFKKKIGRNNEKILTKKEDLDIVFEKSKILQNRLNIDSSLYNNNAITKDQIDESKIATLSLREKVLSLKKEKQNLTHFNKEMIDEISLIEKEKERESLVSSFNVKKYFFELKTIIDLWEYTYVIESPISGKIEFNAPFFNSDQYIKKDQPVFIILPKIDSIYARGVMTANGYGKIVANDSVKIKLKDYPYKEYGELSGLISHKSKVYRDSIYYIRIKLPNGLVTSHGKKINFSYNMSGNVEYLTNRRSLIQRIFSEINNSVGKE